MPAQSGCPIDPVTVVRTSVSLHFDMSDYGCLCVFTEFQPFSDRKGPASLIHVPVPFGYPFPRFMGMAALGPSSELHIGLVVHFAERFLGYYCGIVVAPSPDYGVEPFYEVALRYGPLFPYDFLNILEMVPLCLLRGLDEGLESQLFSMRSFPGLALSHRVLSDMESWKLKSRFAANALQGMSDSSLAGFQTWSHAF